ncbi:MAG: sigma-70 family RNA polymerase sigma factor, partial [Clostridia bacterium]|nr:sigma-70 family RNA polymerase sigma factor [Clostridia bacterium]
MTEFDKDFEKKCEAYLEYLYRLAERRYNDCPDIDSLVQDALAVFAVKSKKGEPVEFPERFLSVVLKNKYNAWLREKYMAGFVEYTDGVVSETYDNREETE